MSRVTRISAAVCGGTLFAWYPESVQSQEAYYAASEDRSVFPRGIFVAYARDGSTEVAIESIAEMFAAIRAQGCQPIEEIRKSPAAFAVLMEFLADVNVGGRVVETGFFWTSLAAHYGFSAEDSSPRVEENCLRFTVASFGTDSSGGRLVKVSVDLDSGIVTKETTALTIVSDAADDE